MTFPYGKAPFWILVLTLLSASVIVALRTGRTTERPDLVFCIFADNHVAAYRKAIAEFEKTHHVKIQLQMLGYDAFTSRLQSAMLTGAEVPDMVELLISTMGYFTRGPLEEVGFVDLTDRLRKEGLYGRMVEERFSVWSSRGHVFALPHDVHPVMLFYRRDLIDRLGIKVDDLKTWDDFTAMGRRITKDLDGDGIPDRYAIDLDSKGGEFLQMLLLQRGGGLFDAGGSVTFDTPLTADTILWYLHVMRGPHRIGFEAGWGQSLAKAVNDGLVLFFVCPDWRSKQFELDVPNLSGQVALMPLPAWAPGGRRTSTWGGTGLAITKACRNQDLAWEFAKFLYLKKEELGERFRDTSILSALKDSWDMPAFDEPRAFYSGQPIGRLYAGLAPRIPACYVSPYTQLAGAKLTEAYLNAAEYFDKHGDEGLRDFIDRELARCAQYVRTVMQRNVFLRPEAPGSREGAR
ncbi:MAG: extracellular solute-binding protein [Planctomycetota bacterium]|nr:extracellular solute-binding protein [Planctomycetota bacterium]